VRGSRLDASPAAAEEGQPCPQPLRPGCARSSKPQLAAVPPRLTLPSPHTHTAATPHPSRDYRDVPDVLQLAVAIKRALGVAESTCMPYKSDRATLQGRYGADEGTVMYRCRPRPPGGGGGRGRRAGRGHTGPLGPA
jgi:hypothetical protein